MNKKIVLLILLTIITFQTSIYANGVIVADASIPKIVRLNSSKVAVNVENQVAIIKTTQVFKNTTSETLLVKYAFPLPEGASATKLMWNWSGVWYTANFSAQKPDTSLPGPPGQIAQSLSKYLGAKPLYYAFERKLKPDSVIIVELTYVQLLPYKYGIVSFTYPNDYRLLQSTVPLDSQSLNLTLSSLRTITSVQMPSHSGASIEQSSFSASVQFRKLSSVADSNYVVKYSLSPEELGLFSFSTNVPDSLGYFTFILEPNPASTVVIPKNFILVIDRSGSMYGTKIVQARNAAKHIVNNLNEGDKFNIVDFEGTVKSFRTGLVDFTLASRDSALQYVNQIIANGWTNISGALATAINQFQTTADTTANIVIFLTDGVPTAGITSTNDLLAHITTVVTQVQKTIYLFAFGIGADVNQQLLTLLASQNNGRAEFLGNDELESRITDFYNSIRNPVLVNTRVSFNSELISELYPNPLPNLYKGQQLIVSGLYKKTPPVTLTFSGTAFGRPVSYQYQLALSDTAIEKYSFLPKIWAKQKIDFLLVRYYSYPPTSGIAKELKEAIIQLSMAYGVLSPFTSFTGGNPIIEVELIDGNELSPIPYAYQLLGNYPNPFNPSTEIIFRVNKIINIPIVIKIYNSAGQLVRVLIKQVNGKGEYRIQWNGKYSNGQAAMSGAYFYIIDFGDAIICGRMTLIK